MHVGLGTDVGAGTSFSMLATMSEAYKVSKLVGYPMTAVKSFYLATRGGAAALGLAGRGSARWRPGMRRISWSSTPKRLRCWSTAARGTESTQELMFVLSILADDRAVAATYIAGHPAYRQEDG